MKFFFLGTSACDFSQKLLTECKDRFDKDARRASCALIGGRYLIDCGLHVLDSLRIAQKDPAQITDVFITHFHSDHFQAENVKAIASMKKNAASAVGLKRCSRTENRKRFRAIYAQAFPV